MCSRKWFKLPNTKSNTAIFVLLPQFPIICGKKKTQLFSRNNATFVIETHFHTRNSSYSIFIELSRGFFKRLKTIRNGAKLRFYQVSNYQHDSIGGSGCMDSQSWGWWHRMDVISKNSKLDLSRTGKPRCNNLDAWSGHTRHGWVNC